VIAGELDQGTPVAMAQTLADAIPGASLTVLKEASHLSAVEQPEAFARQCRLHRQPLTSSPRTAREPKFASVSIARQTWIPAFAG
jgi:hypothetical protein